MSTAMGMALAPIQHILSDSTTEDLAIQEPGVGWWLTGGNWKRVELPQMTYQRLHGIATMAASQTRQVITAAEPILSADLPGGLRLQAVMPPAVPSGTMALTFRRSNDRVYDVASVSEHFETTRWNKWNLRSTRRSLQDAELLEIYDHGTLAAFLTMLARKHKTGLFCGKTGAGKTTLSKMMGAAIPLDERIIAIEDAKELVIKQPNHVRHFYSGSSAALSPATLLKATLRERPDRVMLAEMRDPEAADVFLSEVMAGHPGSLSTIHGRDGPEAARRLFDLVKSSPGRQGTNDETICEQLSLAIDFIIPVENDGTLRAVGEIWFAPEAARRGETFRDLLRLR